MNPRQPNKRRFPRQVRAPGGEGKRPWRRHFIRSLVRTIVLCMLAMAAFAVFVLYYPWSSNVLDRRFQRKWLEATGLELRYERAFFRVSLGEIRIRQPRLIDPRTEQVMLRASSVRLVMPFKQLLWHRPPFLIEQIEVQGPLVLEVINREGRLEMSESWRQIVDRFLSRTGAPSTGAGSSVVLNRVTFQAIQVEFLEPTQTRLLPVYRYACDLDLRFHSSLRPDLVFVKGRMIDPQPSDPFKMAIRPNWPAQTATVSCTMEDFASNRLLAVRIPVVLNFHRGEFRASVDWSDPARWKARGQTTIRGLEIERTGVMSLDEPGPMRLEWVAGYDFARHKIEIRNLRLDSPLGTVDAEGHLFTRSPFGYRLELRSLVLSGRALEILNRHVPQGGRLLTPEDARFRMEATLTGQRSPATEDEWTIPSVTGRVALSGVDWANPALPAPVRRLRAEGVLSTDTLAIEHAEGIVQGIPVRIDGVITCRPLEGRVDAVDLRWRIREAAMEGLNAFISRWPTGASQGLHLGGEVQGEGRFHIDQPLEGGILTALSRSRLEGRLNFNGGVLVHPTLPEPIREITGEVSLSPERAECRDLTGRWMGMDFALNGQAEGIPRFWDYPSVRLAARLNMELGDVRQRIIDYLARRGLAPTVAPPVEGRAEIQLAVNGQSNRQDPSLKPEDWENLVYTGRVALTDVLTSLPTPAVYGPVLIESGGIRFDPENIEMETLRGRLGTVDFKGSGTLRTQGGIVHLELDGPLEEFKHRFPVALKKFRVGGRARILHQTRLEASRDRASEARQWVRWLTESARARPENADPVQWWHSRWRLDHQGRIRMDAAEMTFVTMPARLWNITGWGGYDNRRLRSEGFVPVKAGTRSHGLEGRIEYLFNPRQKPTVFDFTIRGDHLDLDEWVRKWNIRANERFADRAFPRFDETIPPNQHLQGQVRTKTVRFKGLVGENFRGRVRGDYFHLQEDRIRFADIRADLYGGRFDMDARVDEHSWQVSMRLDDAELPKLMQAVVGKDEVHGIFSGQVTGEVELRDVWGEQPEAPIRGQGHLHIRKSRFISNAVLQNLGGLIMLPVLRDVTFNDIEGDFTIEGGRFRTEGLNFDSPFLHLKTVGEIGPQNRLDLEIQLQVLHLAGRVPFVGEAVDMLNHLVGKILKFKVRGTLEEPNISPI